MQDRGIGILKKIIKRLERNKNEYNKIRVTPFHFLSLDSQLVSWYLWNSSPSPANFLQKIVQLHSCCVNSLYERRPRTSVLENLLCENYLGTCYALSLKNFGKQDERLHRNLASISEFQLSRSNLKYRLKIFSTYLFNKLFRSIG